MSDKKNIAIIGMGYVGLPLAVELGKNFNTIGFDIDHNKINNLNNNIDLNFEINSKLIKNSKYLSFTKEIKNLQKSNIFIITVPTPIKGKNQPDLKYLLNACKQIGSIIKKKSIIIIESTVYPGVTEDICAPIIEKYSGYKFNTDFFMGYSPERINPGDKKHTIKNINKITSGSNKKTAKVVDDLYKKIVTEAKTYKVNSIKIAEAAKVIENAQRDINIAFVNELSIIFNKIGLNSSEVFDAANTKWNYLNFRPGLVGGHCIGIDPYYLSYKAKQVGYTPNIILAGRKINEKMPQFITSEIIKISKQIKFNKKNNKILILGITFKENCNDVRNSKVINILKKLKNNKFKVDVCDPKVKNQDLKNIIKLKLKNFNYLNYKDYKIIILAVAHNEFKSINVKKISKNGSIIYDLKNFFNKNYTFKQL